MAVSLSVSSSVAGSTRSPVASPVTWIDSVPSASSSSRGRNVKLREALVRPGWIVIVNGSTTAASWPGPNAASCELRVTTTLVATVRGSSSSVAVTRTDRELVDSLTLDGLTLRITASDSSSSSLILSAARPSASPVAVPTTSSLSVPSAIESSTGRSVKDPLALESPAGIVTVNGLTAR